MRANSSLTPGQRESAIAWFEQGMADQSVARPPCRRFFTVLGSRMRRMSMQTAQGPGRGETVRFQVGHADFLAGNTP
ncbi:hypothetical protein NORO109296_20920 [Nocardiopsis rhodophaea]